MKKQVLLICGGKSGEHEVSVNSALSIEQNIDPEKYEVSVLGITHQGGYHWGKTVAEITDQGKVSPSDQRVVLPVSDQTQELNIETGDQTQTLKVDLVFPIIHGSYGEDGLLQGLLEMCNLPYVGAGVLGSAVCMDKVIQKQICANFKIPQTEYLYFTDQEWENNMTELSLQIEDLGYPIFVKPANLGSSVGISKVKESAGLTAALEEAFQFDHKVLVEKGQPDIMEIEVSVLGNEKPEASVCGSIKPHTEFYDYETKYLTDDIEANVPAAIPSEIADQIRATAIKAFQALNCSGLARADFFYQPGSQEFYLNEINTLPGFTKISMYPKLWQATGLKYSDLITRLLELAEQRWQSKQQLKFSYQSSPQS